MSGPGLGRVRRRASGVVLIGTVLLSVSCGESPADEPAAVPSTYSSNPTSVGPTARSPSPPASGGATSGGTASGPARAAPPPGVLTGRVIVVDPGHNGANHAHPDVINRPVDAGGFMKPCNTTGTATTGGYTESALNFAVATTVHEKLEALGATVVLTRTDDAGVGPCVDQRGLTAERRGADALVSVHADGAPAGARGFHVAHPGPVAGYTDGTVGPSDRLAVAVRDALVAAGFTPSTYLGRRGLVARTDLGTLNRAGVPAVMVELGNMKNRGDAALFQTESGRDRLAGALVNGLAAFLGR